MIRWRYVITRLLIVAVILFVLSLGLGPVARYVTARSLESAIGAKVDIGHTTVGLFPPTVRYQNVQIADPRDDKAMKNAFEADQIVLTIDGNELLHRRWVATEGKITGIQIGSERESSGHFEEEEEHPVSPSDLPTGPSMLTKLVKGMSGQLGDTADAAIDDLETLKRSKVIQTRWEKEYSSLVARARALEKQIREIRDSARGIDNPLRDWEELDRTLARASKAREDLMAVRQAIDSLPERLQNDLALMDEAKRIDLEKVDRYVPGDLSTSDNFGVDLMTKAVREQIQRVKSYVDGGRTIANYTVVAPENDRIRGVDFNLSGENPHPEMLIRHCEVSGLMRANGDTYAIKGDLENLTPTPELLTRPTRASLRLEGPDVLTVKYSRDRRAGADTDLLTLHWPQSESKPMKLGDSDARINVTGGQRELWVQIRTQGDHIDGSVLSRQSDVNLNLQVAPKYQSTAAVASLNQSLTEVDSIEVDAKFQGTWDDVDVKLNFSNLGQIFHRAAVAAVTDQMQATRNKMAAKIDEVHLQKTLELRKWLSSQQIEARGLLASADKSIEEMSRKVIDEIGDADEYLGKLRTSIIGRLRR